MRNARKDESGDGDQTKNNLYSRYSENIRWHFEKCQKQLRKHLVQWIHEEEHRKSNVMLNGAGRFRWRGKHQSKYKKNQVDDVATNAMQSIHDKFINYLIVIKWKLELMLVKKRWYITWSSNSDDFLRETLREIHVNHWRKKFMRLTWEGRDRRVADEDEKRLKLLHDLNLLETPSKPDTCAIVCPGHLQNYKWNAWKPLVSNKY